MHKEQRLKWQLDRIKKEKDAEMVKRIKKMYTPEKKTQGNETSMIIYLSTFLTNTKYIRAN